MTFQELAEEYIIYTVKNFNELADIEIVKHWMNTWNYSLSDLEDAIYTAIDKIPHFWENFLPTLKAAFSHITLNDVTYQSYWTFYWNCYCEEDGIPKTFEDYILTILDFNTSIMIVYLINDLYIHYKNFSFEEKEILTKEQKKIYKKLKERLT